MDDEYLPVPEIARRLKVSPRTVRRWIKARRIPFCRCGPRLLRVSWAHLRNALSGHSTDSDPAAARPVVHSDVPPERSP